MPKASKRKVQELARKTRHPEVVKPIANILSENDLIQYSNQHFTNRTVVQTKFNTGLVKFARFYFLNKTWVKYAIAIILGLVMSIATVLLVEVTGLYTGGFGACLQGVARMVYAAMCKNGVSQESSTLIFNALFWGLYLLLNIPLTLFAYFKINKQFAKLSTVYLLVLQGMGFVWGIIPGIHGVQIFGDTTTVDGNLAYFNVQSIIFAPNWFPIWNTSLTPQSLNWAFSSMTTNPSEDIRNIVVDSNLTRAFLLLVYSVVFALISSVCYALMFILGGSTAGSDYLTIYWSQERNKNVGTIFIIITTISMTIGVLLGSYGAGIIAGDYLGRYASWQYIFSANLFTSLVWVFLNGALINKLFPWHKLIRVEVYSPNINPIKTRLRACGYTHPTTIIDATGGYSNAPTKMLLTICMCVELPKLISYVRQVDPDCLISSNVIADIDGRMALQKQTY